MILFNRAIAMSVALVMSFAVVSPAQAAVPTIAVSVNTVADTDANTAAGAAIVTVPADNKVEAADAVKFALTGVDTGTVVTATATKAFIVSALHTNDAPVTANSGATTLSVNVGTGTTATFYVYTKTTDLGTVVITNGGNTFTYYVKGTAGAEYNVATNIGTTAATDTVVEYTAAITDVFGNAVSGVSPMVTVVGASIDSAATVSDSKGLSKFSVKYGTTAGQVGLSVAISATNVTGLPDAVKTVLKFINVSDLAAELSAVKAAKAVVDADLAAAKAALATATADLAKAKSDIDVLTKAKSDIELAKAASDAQMLEVQKALVQLTADFNRLAAKWNKKFPKAKVALKK